MILVAAVVLETTAGIQYFYSRAALQEEAQRRAYSELRRAELEIEKHTIEMEAAAKTLAMLAERHVNCPDSIYAATRAVVATISNTSSLAVAYVPGYFEGRKMRNGERIGTYFEACSSRISEDSVYTRQIGSAAHDYTQMEWFQNGLSIDSCWWSEPYLDDSGSQAWVVSCSYPVRGHDDAIVAVVCVDLSLDYLQDMSEYLQVYPESFYSITSGTGEKIVPLPDTVAGRKYHTFNEEIDATGWHIAVVIPDSVIYADLRRIGLIITLMMVLGLALLVFILARTVHNVKELVRVNNMNERMEGELEVAQTIQKAMLPKVFPPFADRLDLNIYGIVNPAKEVGGDLYDFYVRHEKLFFCVGDVSGKGVPASLVMATTRSLFRSVTSHEEHAAAVMSMMNDALSDANDQNMFITMFLGVLDLKTGVLEYCNAGHDKPYKVQRDHVESTKDVLEVLECKANLPLGVMAEFPYEAQTIQLHQNDTLFLYTDGLTEAENKAHAQFGEERVMEVLRDEEGKMHGRSPREMIDTMLETVSEFVGDAQQSDDLTMLSIRYQLPALVMRNDIQQIPTLAEWVDWLNVPIELNMPINLALEEIVSNVMLYAYPQDKSGQVMVECAKEDGRLVFTITDSGKPFDPTQREEADITLSAEEREIGGLGIHLVRQLMDEVYYQREDNKNILTLIKRYENRN